MKAGSAGGNANSVFACGVLAIADSKASSCGPRLRRPLRRTCVTAGDFRVGNSGAERGILIFLKNGALDEELAAERRGREDFHDFFGCGAVAIRIGHTFE